MKKTIIKQILLAGIITLIFACNSKKEETAAVVNKDTTVVADKEQIKREIQAKEDEFAATYNAGGYRLLC